MCQVNCRRRWKLCADNFGEYEGRRTRGVPLRCLVSSSICSYRVGVDGFVLSGGCKGIRGVIIVCRRPSGILVECELLLVEIVAGGLPTRLGRVGAQPSTKIPFGRHGRDQKRRPICQTTVDGCAREPSLLWWPNLLADPLFFVRA